MSARDTERAAALERRYRRLLRCYPHGHRQVHREEMLGVLLATARPGQRAPGARQTVNLVACGLAIRARRALAGEPWQDALAVVSLITPALMLVIAALDFAVAARQVVAVDLAYPLAGPFWQLGLVPRLGAPAAVMTGWLAVVLLGLTGRRRVAAAIAFILLTPALVGPLAEVMQLTGAWSAGLPLFLYTAGVGPVVIASLAACSLGFSAGPQRGLAIAGRRRICLMIAVLSVVFGLTAVVYLVKPSASLTGSGFTLLGVLALAVAVVVTRVRGTVDWRVSALVAAPAFLLDAVSIPFAGSLTATAVLSLGNLLFAVLVWPVAITSWRGRVRRSSHALPA
jgi:hypothetical protein